MSSEAKQTVTECPRCGAPGDALIGHEIGGSECDYAAGLRERVADYARKLLIRDGELDAMAERAERAEAALQHADVLLQHLAEHPSEWKGGRYDEAVRGLDDYFTPTEDRGCPSPQACRADGVPSDCEWCCDE